MKTQAKATTVFYVDDDSDDRSFFEEAIEELGENVKLFELGDDMLRLLKNPPPKPSVIFLDLNMPYKNGFEILDEIRSSEAFQGLPIVVYSTTSANDTIQKCLDLGASYYITKVVSLSSLVNAIKTVISMDWENFKPNMDNFVYKHK
jgi:response regulator RpfG family c-di-GMP phosphodiesterase